MNVFERVPRYLVTKLNIKVNPLTSIIRRPRDGILIYLEFTHSQQGLIKVVQIHISPSKPGKVTVNRIGHVPVHTASYSERNASSQNGSIFNGKSWQALPDPTLVKPFCLNIIKKAICSTEWATHSLGHSSWDTPTVCTGLPQRKHDQMIMTLLRQNHIATPSWLNNDVIIT